MKKTLDNLLIKPAGPDCNLRCAYCFYYQKEGIFPAGPHRMSEETLENLVRAAGAAGREAMSFGWQGGEPTLMGLDFFERAVALEEKHCAHLQPGNGLQTNGLLLDEKWARFLARENFLVGLSLDGPEEVHDRYRRFADGRRSFAKVRDCASLLLDAGVQVNALSVINDHSANFAAESYAFFKSIGLTYMQFIPCVEPDPERPGQAAPWSVSAEAFGRFLVTLFDLWTRDFRGGVPATSIRFFDSIFYRYVGLEPPDCSLRAECGIYLAVEHNGDIFPCDFFVDPSRRLGNINDGDLARMLNSKAQQAFGQSKARLDPACGCCRWLELCRGGCLKERGFGREPRARSFLCKGYRAFFEHADAALRQLGEDWRAAHPQDLARLSGVPTKPPGRNDPCPCGSGRKFKRCCGA